MAGEGLEMSVVYEAGDAAAWGDDPAGLNCFFCGRSLSFPALFWSGVPAGIYVDLRCWPELSERLSVDSYASKRALRLQGTP